MICPNCSITLQDSEIMCSNCGEIIDRDGIDFDKNAKLIETVNDEELLDIATPFDDDDDFEEYVPKEKKDSEHKSLLEKLSKKNAKDVAQVYETDDIDNLESYADSTVDEVDIVDKTENTEETNDLNTDLSLDGFNDNSIIGGDEGEGKLSFLNLNFYSFEKFVSTITSDVNNEERDTYVKEEAIEFEDVLKNFEEDISISNNDLVKKIAESSDMHQAQIERIEREKIENIENFYKEYRFTILTVLKRVLITFAIIANGLMIYDLVTNNFAKLSSQLYANDMVETYSKLTWENIEYIIELNKILIQGVDDFENNKISEEELVKIAKKHIEVIDGRNEMFFKQVYDEAEEYLFTASKFAFLSQYLSENIIDYFDTNNPIYRKSYKEATVKLLEFYDILESERIKFLKTMGFKEIDIERIVSES